MSLLRLKIRDGLVATAPILKKGTYGAVNRRWVRVYSTPVESSSGEAFSRYTIHLGCHLDPDRYWSDIPRWKDVTVDQFLSHKWQMFNTVQNTTSLFDFLRSVLPVQIPSQRPLKGIIEYPDVCSSENFIHHVQLVMRKAPMAVRLSPHILSVINWSDPLNDPVRRQFIPLIDLEHRPPCRVPGSMPGNRQFSRTRIYSPLSIQRTFYGMFHVFRH